MTNQAEKTDLKTKLSTLGKTMASFASRCKPVWFVVKQTWFVPFLWTLAWYSYWIFHSVIVLKTPFYEGNTSNYVGATVSVAALLLAGYQARTPIRKSVGIAAHSLLRKPLQTNQPKQPHPDLKLTSSTIPKQNQKEISSTPKPAQIPSSISTFSTSRCKPEQSQTSKDFSSECLVCGSLINCTYRQKRTIELSTQTGNNAACPYTSKVSPGST